MSAIIGQKVDCVLSPTGDMLLQVTGNDSAGKSNLSISHISPEFMKNGFVAAVKDKRVLTLKTIKRVVDGNAVETRTYIVHEKWVKATKDLPKPNLIVAFDDKSYREMLISIGIIKPKIPLTPAAPAN